MKRLSSLFLALILSFTLATQGWAAVTFSLLQASSNNSDATSYTTGSVTPTNGNVVYLFLHNTKASTPDAPSSFSGTNGWNGVTWTKVNDGVNDGTITFGTIASPNNRISCYSGVPVSSVAGTITISFGANTQTSLGWEIWQTAGAASSGYTLQVKTGNANTATALTVTLDNATTANSNTIGCIAKKDNSATTPGTGWTEDAGADITWIGPNSSLECNYKAADTSCDWAWTGAAGAGGILVEVAILPVGGGCVPTLALRGLGC